MFHDRFKRAELDKVCGSRFAEDKSCSERLQRKSWVSSPIEYCSHRTLFNYSKQKSNHLGIINSVRFIIREVKVRKEKKKLTKERNPRTFARQNVYQAASLRYALPRLERGIWVLHWVLPRTETASGFTQKSKSLRQSAILEKSEG